ncbi:MAG: hypothetical protein GY913_31830 [Proteobacteria bacterium]|nr:hypothetical protein [Pseudomonadota bacterium]MCP4921510.1 hypothetical protein [Pseudomonadota bacterium]
MPRTLRNIHITNADGRDATVQFTSIKAPKPPTKGVVGREVKFKRFLATTESGTHATLSARIGEDYADALLEGDPEIDIERVGRAIGETHVVQLSARGEVLYAAPEIIEIIQGPDGQERERRAPTDTPANVNDELPVRWTGRMMPKQEVVRRFVFGRTLQLRHIDGLSYDYLHGMAKLLAEDDAVMRMGAGPKGRQPLILTVNGSPCHGFLEGRVDGSRYQLLLHLSNMELKRPEEQA